MSPPKNRFQDFFDDERYVALKNHLYNYLIRKREIEKYVSNNAGGPILEVGSGLSPMVTRIGQVVFMDLSFSALQELKNRQKNGWFVVADGTRLPFKDASFSQAVCSEVLEHLRDDISALREIARVMQPSGALVLTFPHRHFYYAADDRFVRHVRRYELSEMMDRLREVGLKPVLVRKVLGPLEKITMLLAVHLYVMIQARRGRDRQLTVQESLPRVMISVLKWSSRIYGILAWLDAKLMPRGLATVLLVKAIKH
jgi:ubiquinone/menaquinone biosynthesis C-methylase UbiE